MDQQQDLRLSLIKDWLPSVLKHNDYQIEPASSDASFRRYFRVRSGENSWIVMDAPPQKEDITQFVDIAKALYINAINVPEILAKDDERGLLLLTDFGNTAYLSVLNDNTADKLYQDAIDSLIAMQCSAIELHLPEYNNDLLLQELNLFPDWFLKRHLSMTAPEGLDTVFAVLIDNAMQQPYHFVHRDYHSRNLMVTDIKNPGIIDFQDAVIGPISYDLVSLLRDCYIAWPEHKIEQWIGYYFNQVQHYGLLQGNTLAQFVKWFDLMGLQRHLKVLGIFCRLYYRDNKANYLADLPLTLHYAKQISAKYPEMRLLTELLNNVDLDKPL